ncbi:DnaJ domain-containing protein [Methylobacterium soli]|uniref:DnaJ domain-containing protein n=1 Tax=Methylobacterium soli TaxID=553447 RepID=UPI001AEF4A03|nr:DnaJ domain-containing protein [Methylobacterium soli]GJE43763.1 Chaperone protein DnaJ [Methylobacterium soli]
MLGIPTGARQEEIKAAYRERAKRYHPDLSGGGADDEARFRRVQEAYETLSKGHGLSPCGEAGPGADEEAGFDDDDLFEKLFGLDPVRLVRKFMKLHDIEILFDGSMQVRAASRMAHSRMDIDGWLAATEFDPHHVVDEVMLDVRVRVHKTKKGDIERALRKITREDQQRRRNVVVKPLLSSELTASERDRAESEWIRLISGVFDGDMSLGVAVMKHFIWQVKQKLLGRPVKHHLMPVIFSPVQGSGKTTFVLKFLAPLKELATDPVLLSDFADKRSGDIYRYPVVFIDDVDRIATKLVPVLKSLVTSEGLRRRKLGTSYSVKLRQLTTPIGTANEAVDDLIADETGNRRFFGLRFRNGAVAKGGDPAVWEIVGMIDFELLWRSVDAFSLCPIEPYLGDLVAAQEAARRPDVVEAWLGALDLTSDEVASISTKAGVKAKPLWELFSRQTGSGLSLTKFGLEMAHHAANPELPFGPKVATMSGTFYPIKKG